MQAILIYNPNSGGITTVNLDELIAALAQAGYEPIHRATSCEDDLDLVLANFTGLVVVAGGDGTVRAVATRLLGKNVPISILPLGTANNIARSWGLERGPLEIIAGLQYPERRSMDIGYVRAPWGDDYFLEGCGYGLFADMLALYDPQPIERKSVIRGISSTITALANYRTYPSQLTLDGEDISGDYLLVEVLNTTAIGSRLKLAPQADPGDGLLEVIRIRQDERDNFFRYVTSLLTETLAELPSVELTRGRRLDFNWTGFNIHVDEKVYPGVKGGSPDESLANEESPTSPGTAGSLVSIEIMPQALELWLPSPEPSL